MGTIIITGGTGLIGSALSQHLIDLGYTVIILTRDAAKGRPRPGLTYAAWDIEKGTIDASAIGAADFIVHLAGAGVADKRWSAKRKKEIVNSRVKSGALLVKAISEIPNNIRGVIGSSAIGYYGPDPKVPNNQPFRESDDPNNDFLAQTCVQWEESLLPLKSKLRLIQIRIGIVLSKNGGAMEQFMKPLKFGIAAILGSGSQVVSWIHIDDVVRFISMAIQEASVFGVYNLVAPAPVTNKELTLTMARQLKGKNFIPVHVPAFALRLGLGEMSVEILKSATVSSSKIQLSGFTFLHPSIESAMMAIDKHRSS